MSQLHQITPEHIARLAPDQLVELLRYLLYAEARVGGAKVHVPTQIFDPDGGEDGRWEGAVTGSEYIPDKFTIYQSKAQELSPSDCAKAVLDSKGNLSPAVREVLAQNGRYVFFCSHGYVQRKLTARINAAVTAIFDAGGAGNVAQAIAFLDGNKIAAWTNQHPAAMAHVAKCCSIFPVGILRTWADWQRDQACQFNFHSNATIDAHIDSLRGHLAKAGSVARITAMSGMGKTRLAFEALRPSADGKDVARSSLSYASGYLDMEHAPAEVMALVSAIDSSGRSGLLVIDNCAREKHDALTNIVKRVGSKLSLLTLDYVPEPPIPGVLHISLEQKTMQDVVPRILREMPAARDMSESQINYIANFAQGFPQIATLMLEVGDALDLERLDTKGLARRIIWGRSAPNETALRALRAMSIFSHVGFEGDKKRQKTCVRERLCGPPVPSEREFDEQLKPFFGRRIIQKAGSFRMVAPAPLAVALAADWWETANADEFNQLLPHIQSADLMEFFCARVQQLHFSPNATALAAQLCGATGPLSDAGVLSSEPGSQLFRAFVELNPGAAVDCLCRVYGQTSLDDLRKVTAGRRNLVWALEKICWGRDEFLRGAAMLLRFAAAENERWSNNATGQFKHLFQLYLSGTQMPALDRLPVVVDGLASGDPTIRHICVEALGVGLNSGHFSRSGGVEVRGSGLPQEDWRPRSNKEAFDYWARCFRLLANVVLEKSVESPLAQRELGGRLRGVLMPAMLDEAEPIFRQVAEALGGFWPEALDSLHSLLEFEGASYPPADQVRLRQWVQWVSPNDLKHRLILTVSTPSFRHVEAPGGKFIDVAQRNAEALADELALKLPELCRHLALLLTGEQRHAFAFGHRLAEKVPDKAGFIKECLASLRQIPVAQRNPSLLGGYLHGMQDRLIVTQVFEQVASEPALVDMLVFLTRCGPPTAGDLKRVFDLMIAGKIAPAELRQFAYGSVLGSLSPAEAVAQFHPLLDTLPDAAPAIFDVMAMYVHGSGERWQACRDFLREIMMRPRFSLGLKGTMDLYHWEQAAKLMLEGQTDIALAEEITRQIIEAQRSSEHRFRGDSARRNMLGIILSRYSEACWPLIGEELLSENHYQIGFLLEEHGFNEHGGSVLWLMPVSQLLAWVRTNPIGKERLLSVMSLFTIDEKGDYQWHPTALALLGEGVDESGRRAVARNLISYGSTGSRVPYIRRRINLLRQLETSPAPGLREMAQWLIKGFEEDLSREQRSDEEEAAGIY